MKKCPFCGEKIQNAAIKCRFCYEYLSEDASTNKSEKNVTPRRDYRRVGIIALILYFVAFSNSPISHIGDKLREGEIIQVITTETEFLVGLLLIIAGFVIGKNKVVRWILGILFGLSILYAIGISWNKEQKEIDRQMTILFSTTECQKSFGSGSHGDGTSKIGGGYNCYCNDQYTRNAKNTQCITPTQLCKEKYGKNAYSNGYFDADGYTTCYH